MSRVDWQAVEQSMAYGSPISTSRGVLCDWVHELPDVDSELSDVACMFSGGIDSSVVATRLLAEGREVHPFILTWGEGDDEIKPAAAAAKELGLVLNEVRCGVKSFVDCYDEIPRWAPHARPSYYPILRAAHSAGFKCIYSGEGADEIYLGYMRYGKIMRYRKWRFLSSFMHPGRCLPGKWGRFCYLMTKRGWPAFYAAHQTRVLDYECPSEFQRYDDKDWVVATMKCDYAKLVHYLDNCCRVAKGIGIQLVTPIMACPFRPSKHQDYWNGHTQYGKYPLVKELLRVNRKIAEIAMRPKHGFSPPPMKMLWDAGLRAKVLPVLTSSQLLDHMTAYLRRQLKSPRDECAMRAMTEAYTIHRFLDKRGLLRGR